MPKAQKNNEQTSTVQNTTELLEPEEVLLCKQLAAADPPWSQRAQALLAIHHGSTADAAGVASGLRTTQVNFWLNKFNQIGLGIFPEQLLSEAKNNTAVSIEPPSGEDLPASDASSKVKGKNKKKKKKTSQTKDKKKKNKNKKKTKKNKGKKKSGEAKQK